MYCLFLLFYFYSWVVMASPPNIEKKMFYKFEIKWNRIFLSIWNCKQNKTKQTKTNNNEQQFSQVWWCRALIPTLLGQRQEDLSEVHSSEVGTAGLKNKTSKVPWTRKRATMHRTTMCVSGEHFRFISSRDQSIVLFINFFFLSYWNFLLCPQL